MFDDGNLMQYALWVSMFSTNTYYYVFGGEQQ